MSQIRDHAYDCQPEPHASQAERSPLVGNVNTSGKRFEKLVRSVGFDS